MAKKMTLAQINTAIQKVEPLVELARGEGYHYYSFDNVAPGYRAIDPDVKYVEGTELVSDTESVMVCYLKQQEPAVWVADGILFGAKIRERHNLPLRQQGDN